MPSLTDRDVHDAIVRHGSIQQAAAHLGVSRQHLYNRFSRVLRRTERARARRVRLPPSLVERLDERAAAAGKNRTAYVLESLAILPKRLPASDPGAWNGSGAMGRAIQVRLPRSAWARLDATGAAAGTLRALLMELVAR